MPTTDRTTSRFATTSHRAVRVATAWMLMTLLCVVSTSTAATQPAAASTQGRHNTQGRHITQGRYNPCSGNQGITVVVDFHGEGGRGVEAGCATGSPANGLKALGSAGFPVAQFGAAVCQIDGLPTSVNCNRMPPADAFWSYWLAPGGGDWKFSNEGSATTKPKPGTTEGWSFARGSSTAPPPREWTPPAPSTTAATTSPPTTSAPETGGGGSGHGDGQPGNSSGNGNDAKPSKPQAAPKPGGTTKPDEQSTKNGEESTAGENAENSTADSADGDASPTDSSATEPDGETADADGSSSGGDPDTQGGNEVASSRTADVQAQNAATAHRPSDDQDNGSPLPLIFAVVAAAALFGIGIRASRRNRAAS